MNTIKCSWNSGNFTLSHEVKVDDKGTLALAEKGLLWHMQRNREHDVVLGAMTNDRKLARKDAKGNGPWRKEGFKRGDVGYSPELAEKLQATYAAFGDEGAEIDVLTTVAEYIRDVADSKFTEETAIATRHESANDLEVWLKEKCKYEGETHGEDGEFDVAMLRSIRALKLEVLRASAANI